MRVRFMIVFTGLTVILFSGLNALQAGGTKDAAPDELVTLRKAYSALRVADHDYKGHRVKAMHAIEEACKALGASATGEGKAEEPQAESDAHLRVAQHLLESIDPATTGSKSKAAKHIQHAISELTTALSIK